MKPIHATFRDGVFLPEEPVTIPDGSHVTLWIASEAEDIEHLRDVDREFLRELAERRKVVFDRLAE